MGWLEWMRRLRARARPRSLNEWFHVTFDDQRVYLRAEPPGKEAWTQDFAWDSVVRIAFAAEDYLLSDGIYVFTSQRPESYAIPTEADGGSEVWAEILRRGLFDPKLAIDALCSPGGLFVWPPDGAPAAPGDAAQSRG